MIKHEIQHKSCSKKGKMIYDIFIEISLSPDDDFLREIFAFFLVLFWFAIVSASITFAAKSKLCKVFCVRILDILDML